MYKRKDLKWEKKQGDSYCCFTPHDYNLHVGKTINGNWWGIITSRNNETLWDSEEIKLKSRKQAEKQIIKALNKLS